VTIPTSFLDELRARTSLSGLIGKTTKLTKAGNEHKGCCPFHNEKSPSFYVNDDKGFYHCFGCSVHGDAIKWMTDQRGLSFIDAVKDLATAAGMEVPAQTPEGAQRDQAREANLQVMDRAAAFFAHQLTDGSAQLPRDYLVARDISPDVARHFGMGWAPLPTNSGLPEALRGVSSDRLVQLGLRREREGQTFDFFRGRLMFPIHDTRGRCIGFGGRAMGDQQPKYMNTPDTPIFDKGRTLYNHHRAAPGARKSGRLIVVEGYMDVVGLYRAGIEEAVAPNGTALTAEQLTACWRLVDRPILCFDGDSAGRRAAAKAARNALPLLVPGKSLAFVTPPEGQDPDDVLRKEGAAAVSAMFAEPRQLADVLWEAETTGQDVTSPDGIAALRIRIRQILSSIRDPDLGEAYASEFTVRMRALTERNRPPAETVARTGRQSNGTVGLDVEASVITGLLLYPKVAAARFEDLTGIPWRDERSRRIVDLVVDTAMLGTIDANTLPAALERAGLATAAREIAQAAVLPFTFLRPDGGADVEAQLSEVIGHLIRR
jgi:DNA primase